MNWVEFFNDYLIPYTTAGPNTSRGWVSIQCPFCGDDDPSMHMGINLDSGVWRCWRYANHKGNKPARLLNELARKYPLGLDTGAIIDAYTTVNPDSFDAPQAIKNAPQGPLKPVKWPAEFENIEPFNHTGKFWSYLLGRGFEPVGKVIAYYKLKACLTGKYKGRVIIPIHEPEEYHIIGWQARAIHPKVKSRYLSSSPQVKRVLFNQVRVDAVPGRILFVCEGPFDAMKLDFYGEDCRAVATMGVTFTEAQAAQLLRLRGNFERMVALFDPDAAGLEAGFSLTDYIPGLEHISVPEGLEDIGAANPEQVRKFIKEV